MKCFVILILIGFVTGPYLASEIFADSSQKDDNYLKFTLDDFHIYADDKRIRDISLDWNGKSLPHGTITFDEKLDSDINIMIPKNIPRMMNLDFGSSMAVFYTDTLVEPIKEPENDCFYHLRINVNNVDQIDIDSISVAAGRWEPVTVNEYKCDEVYKHYFDSYESGPAELQQTYTNDFPVPESEQDRPAYENCGPGTTLQDGICVANETNENKSPSYKWGKGYSNLLIESPLKQIKSGVALVDVQCNEGKYPAYKYDRMSMACVSEETQSELWSKGWATMRFYTEEDTLPHALCNNYDGKWHPEHKGYRGNITDLQCSLMGGKFVDDLKICYNEICPVDKTYTLCVTDPDLIVGERENEN